MRKHIAVITTLLAGSHMAQFVISGNNEVQDPAPYIQNIQGWGGGGYYGDYQEGNRPYRYGPGGFWQPNYSDNYYGGRVQDPESLPTLRRWNWESRQRGEYNNPPWAGRGWGW